METEEARRYGMSNLNASLSYLRASLWTRVARLQVALRDHDRGASAVELAVITAVILGIAIALLVVIQNFVTGEQGKISGG
jgi:Flp pilus assembly pilin Flp